MWQCFIIKNGSLRFVVCFCFLTTWSMILSYWRKYEKILIFFKFVDSEWNSIHPFKIDKTEGCVLSLHLIFLLIISGSKINATSRTENAGGLCAGTDRRYKKSKSGDSRRQENLPSFATWVFNDFHYNEKNYTAESLTSLIIWCLKVFSFALASVLTWGWFVKMLTIFQTSQKSTEAETHWAGSECNIGAMILHGNLCLCLKFLSHICFKMSAMLTLALVQISRFRNFLLAWDTLWSPLPAAEEGVRISCSAEVRAWHITDNGVDPIQVLSICHSLE